ncbi:MAG: hypothetical protein BA862_13565 [Desulfobulbaceae bacterium S3730MH12]|nr:MAG: hypothetical protein BA862_13565 [Desulfobulbaceae bacterium S3730MH12]OEU81606.1 MAG: hypothetical protein BA873_07440 [Desulfobulbaceae bacterium C00003063]
MIFILVFSFFLFICFHIQLWLRTPNPNKSEFLNSWISTFTKLILKSEFIPWFHKGAYLCHKSAENNF